MNKPSLNASPILTHVVAVAANYVIGNAGGLPWHIPGELAWFKQVTLHKPIIMGRKTWESLPRKPLPLRPNLVVSRDSNLKLDGAETFTDLEQAIHFAKNQAQIMGSDEIAIIGGAELFKQSLPFVNRLYYTHISLVPEGDVFYPELNLTAWQLVKTQAGPTSPPSHSHPNGYHCQFRIYDRV